MTAPATAPCTGPRPGGAEQARWSGHADVHGPGAPVPDDGGQGPAGPTTGGRAHVEHAVRSPVLSGAAPIALVVLGPTLDGLAVLGRMGAAVLAALLVVYRRVVSPLLGPRCRFHPTCSAYALDALRAHGLLRGVAKTLVRLAKCGPWHPGGLDPVTPRAHRRAGTGAPITEEHAL